MRLWSRSAPALLLGAALAGCDGSPPSHSGSPPPAAVNPNLPQVTLEVPGMTWPGSWGPKVRKALESLPWVEKGSVRPDCTKQQVTFSITDRNGFNMEDLRKAITASGFRVGKVLRGP